MYPNRKIRYMGPIYKPARVGGGVGGVLAVAVAVAVAAAKGEGELAQVVQSTLAFAPFVLVPVRGCGEW